METEVEERIVRIEAELDAVKNRLVGMEQRKKRATVPGTLKGKKSSEINE